MLSSQRSSGLIVIGMPIILLMIALAAMIALPILTVATALSLALAGPARRRLERMRADAMSGPVIDGEWTVVDPDNSAEQRTRG